MQIHLSDVLVKYGTQGDSQVWNTRGYNFLHTMTTHSFPFATTEPLWALKTHFECWEGIRGYVKGGHFHIAEEVVEFIGVEHSSG